MKHTCAAALILLVALPCLAQEHKEYSAREQAKQVIAAREARALEQQLIAREKSLFDAEKRHDWPAVAQLLAEDFLEIAGDGKLYTKSDVAAYFPDVQVNDYTQEDIRALRAAPDAVLVTSTVRVDATFRGQRVPSHSYVATLWVRRGREWKIVFHQVTPIPEPAPAPPK